MLHATTLYIAPTWLPRFSDSLVAAQSTRHGGVSPAPFQSLNLSWHTEDAHAHVVENRRRFATAVGILPTQLTGGRQVHGDAVKVVAEVAECAGYDSFITNQKGIVLAVTLGDCVPVLIYDPVQKAVGAAHAGWKGTVAQIAGKTLRAMQEMYGTQAADCFAFIGAAIGKDDFLVDADVADHFTATHKTFDPELDKYRVDLKQANADQLLALGLPSQQLDISPYSTVAHNEHFFSHRAEHGATGRMLAVIGLKDG